MWPPSIIQEFEKGIVYINNMTNKILPIKHSSGNPLHFQFDSTILTQSIFTVGTSVGINNIVKRSERTINNYWTRSSKIS